MYSLPIGSPRIVPIALFGVKTWPLKHFPWQRAEIDVDMGKIYGIAL